MKRFLCLGLALLLLCAILPGCAQRDATLLYVTVLDVGQGDAILISCGEHHVLIDTGSAVSRGLLLGELARLGVEDLDAILITHPHEDHYGNARMLLETRTVGALFLPASQGEEVGYSILLESAAKCNVPISVLEDGDSFPLHGAVCEVFCPIADDPDPNNACLVLRVRYGTSVFLFMGDAEQRAEQALLARGGDWSCDLLKVGHHGSDTASTSAFLQACAPKMAAISCGANNDYGFPHGDVLDGLCEIGAAVYRTDENGSLCFSCDGKSVIFEE